MQFCISVDAKLTGTTVTSAHQFFSQKMARAVPEPGEHWRALSSEDDTEPEPSYRSFPGLAGFRGIAHVERKIQQQMIYTTK